MSVRRGTIEDLEGLVPLALNFHKNSIYKDFQYEADKVLKTLINLLTQDDCCVFVLERDGKLVGFLAGTYQPGLFTHESTAIEIAWWVEEDARSIRSLDLVRAYEAWAREKGCRILHTCSLDDNYPQITRLYSRMGLSPCEHSFMKVL
jgi:hypothetical protein